MMYATMDEQRQLLELVSTLRHTCDVLLKLCNSLQEQLQTQEDRLAALSRRVDELDDQLTDRLDHMTRRDD